MTTDRSPRDVIALHEANAQRRTTPCGDGAMVWRVWGQEAGKRPLVLLHGGSGSWTHWIKQIPAFADRYEVWAPDMPGLGDSDMPHAPLTPATCGEVVAQGIYELLPAERRPHLVAFSFGAHVGTFAATLLGDRLASFTITGSAALGLPHARRDFAKEHALMTDAERAEVHRANLAILMIAEPTRIDELAIHAQAENIRRARFKSRLFATTDEIARTLPQVQAPFAAIWGARDQICLPDVESRRRLLHEVRPDILWRLIPDAGHWSMYEQPEAFNATLADLLAALEGR